MGLGGEENAGEIEGGFELFRATDSNNGSRVKGSQRENVMVWWGRGAGGAKGADVNQRALERAIRAFFYHLVGDGRENLGDLTRPAPGDDMLGSSAGAYQLGVGGRDVNLNAIVKLERCRSALSI